MSSLNEIVEQVSAKVFRYGKGSVRKAVINEENTKATLIQPILRGLGWNVEDLDDVHLEYKQKSKDKPVDFALMLQRTPCLFVEAKALGESLDDRKWANQIMGYASVAGVEWVVLTDGDEYRIYNSHATVPVDEKLFRKVRVSDPSSKPAETLALLSKDQMHDRHINRMWDAHFIDRQVQSALQQIFAADREPDAAFVRLLNKRIPKLTASEIKVGLRRVQVQVSCPVTFEKAKKSPAAKAEPLRRPDKPSKPNGKSTDKAFIGVSLSELLEQRLITSPLKLFRNYKGVELSAVVQADGTVEFGGKSYNSCSSAAEQARGSVVGGKPNTNGWTFWQYKLPDGHVALLDEPRQQFLKRLAGTS